MWIHGSRSLPPASSSSTRFFGSAESRLASTQPAEPAPTITKSTSSNRSITFPLQAPLDGSLASHRHCADSRGKHLPASTATAIAPMTVAPMIVATAGHVDHGKTSLVRRLTGVDTDRLPEEKRRGLTIELGFAFARLPDGTEIGFVDVPGHERFLRNMLAGVMGIDSALLVVAADDGPMPQTREHLAILDLIGVAQLAIAVSKTDRVSPARVGEVGDAMRASAAARGFPDVAILPVSSETGEGIAALQAHLAALARARVARRPGAGFRLAVDRCFTLPGAGTIVTGTVAAGGARVGDLLLLTPLGTQVRVRNIHAQDRDSTEARAGD